MYSSSSQAIPMTNHRAMQQPGADRSRSTDFDDDNELSALESEPAITAVKELRNDCILMDCKGLAVSIPMLR